MKKFVTALIAVFILTTTVFAEDGFIRVDNGVLRKGEEELVLNGVNLGGWLLMETWMGPVEDDYEEMAYSDVVSILINRFGREGLMRASPFSDAESSMTSPKWYAHALIPKAHKCYLIWKKSLCRYN